MEITLWRPQEGVGGCVVAAGGPEVGRQRRDGHTMETLAANGTSRLRCG